MTEVREGGYYEYRECRTIAVKRHYNSGAYNIYEQIKYKHYQAYS